MFKGKKITIYDKKYSKYQVTICFLFLSFNYLLFFSRKVNCRSIFIIFYLVSLRTAKTLSSFGRSE